jgi:hypothetical protein
VALAGRDRDFRAVALAFLAPQVAAFGFLAIAVFMIMRTRGERSAAPS